MLHGTWTMRPTPGTLRDIAWRPRHGVVVKKQNDRSPRESL